MSIITKRFPLLWMEFDILLRIDVMNLEIVFILSDQCAGKKTLLK